MSKLSTFLQHKFSECFYASCDKSVVVWAQAKSLAKFVMYIKGFIVTTYNTFITVFMLLRAVFEVCIGLFVPSAPHKNTGCSAPFFLATGKNAYVLTNPFCFETCVANSAFFMIYHRIDYIC